MKVLEELWYGNIKPAEYDVSPCEECKYLLGLITRNKERLLATMTVDQKALFSRYID